MYEQEDIQSGGGSQSIDVTAQRLALREAGYSPVPLQGKRPLMNGWEKQVDADPAEIKKWGWKFSHCRNTGIITKRTPTLDIDILDERAAIAVEALVRDRFAARGQILTRVGLPPKRAILFRTNAPFKKITVNFAVPDGSKEQKLELLCDGQQVAAFGIHPDTGKSYAWYGGAPGEVAREQLPEITEVEAREIVDAAAELLRARYGYTRAAERPKNRSSVIATHPGAVLERFGEEIAGGNGHTDWQWLLDNIYEGRELHDSLRDLAAKFICSGMGAGATVNSLRALMSNSKTPHDARWQDRYNDIPRLVESAEEKFKEPEPEPKPTPAPYTLEQVHVVFWKWFDKDYDLAALDVVLAAAAAEKLTGDPLWLLLISGPGGAKTETVGSLEGAGAHVTSTIASEGALLSAQKPKKAYQKTATGGLLRKIGERGILVIKDVTTILSADRNQRGPVLAALREIYDGKWERNVGSEGGQTLTWRGRIVVIGAVTTAWDTHHGVVAALGDRFVLIRMDSSRGRSKAARKSIGNTGNEVAMRAELRAAAGGLLEQVCTDELVLTDAEIGKIAAMADIVTRARTAVERDYKGDVTDVHAPEMPTRLAKQLTQVVRGGVSIGIPRGEAMRLAVRCARDSIPPLRLEILLDIAKNPKTSVGEVRRRNNKPWKTTKREMDALQMLDMLQCTESVDCHGGEKIWNYEICRSLDIETLREMADIDPLERWRRQSAQ
jgi:hypothetical protein